MSGVSFFECKHARECVRLLLLTIFLQVTIMSSREESASKTVEAHGAFMMQAMHQQFEWLNFLFEEIKDGNKSNMRGLLDLGFYPILNLRAQP